MNIPIELLTTGTLLYIPELHNRGMVSKCDDFGTVERIEDDGEGVLLTLEFAVGVTDTHYVPHGSTVEFGGRGQPRLEPCPTPLEILSLAETRRRDPGLAMRMATAAGSDVKMASPATLTVSTEIDRLVAGLGF